MAYESGEAAWYETKTVAAIDAFYSSGNTKDNLEYARGLLDAHTSLETVVAQLDHRKDDEFVYTKPNSALQGPQFEQVTRKGYLEAIGLALDREVPVPIKTFWQVCDVDEFKIRVANGVERVYVKLEIPRKLLKGWELEHETCGESWVATAGDGPALQTSGPPNATLPSARGAAD